MLLEQGSLSSYKKLLSFSTPFMRATIADIPSANSDHFLPFDERHETMSMAWVTFRSELYDAILIIFQIIFKTENLRGKPIGSAGTQILSRIIWNGQSPTTCQFTTLKPFMGPKLVDKD